MGRIASELADVAIVTSDNPRSEDPRAIIDEIVAGAHGELEVEPDRREAIARAIEPAAPGDVVVIAGQGPRAGQQFARPNSSLRRPRSRPRGPEAARGAAP